MGVEVEVQTLNEVKQIDHRRDTKIALQKQAKIQTNHMDTINTKLDDITTAVDNIDIGGTTDIDFTEVTDMISDINTDVIVAQNEDMFDIIQEQNDKINTLEEKLNEIQGQNNKINYIEEKLDLILEKL